MNKYTEEEKEKRAMIMQIIDVMNGWCAKKGVGTISQKYFMEVAEKIVSKIKEL